MCDQLACYSNGCLGPGPNGTNGQLLITDTGISWANPDGSSPVAVCDTIAAVNASGQVVPAVVGAAGQAMTMVAGKPTWGGGGLPDVVAGENLVCYDDTGCASRLPNGTDGQTLTIIGGKPGWGDVASALPSLTASFTQADGTAANQVVFTDTSVGADGCTPDSWLWDFGDGQTSTAQNPTHTYAAGGNYTVTLTTNCSDGALSRTATQTVIIAGITPAFTPTVMSGDSPLVVLMRNQTTFAGDCEPATYVWHYSDDNGATWVQFSTAKNPSLTLDVGEYQIRLTATCADGTTAGQTIQGPIVVYPDVVATPTLDASFTQDKTSVVAGGTVAFTDTSVGANGCTKSAWLWDFGDGQTSTAQNPTHTYAAAGNYPVTLTVDCADGQLTDSAFGSVAVTAAPSLAASFTQDNTSAAIGDTVTFTDTSVGADGCTPDSWLWDFGDGQTSTAQSPTHTYATAGNYTVTLTTNCSDGSLSDNATSTVTITSAPVARSACYITPQDALRTAGFLSQATWDAANVPWDTAFANSLRAGGTQVINNLNGDTGVSVSVTGGGGGFLSGQPITLDPGTVPPNGNAPDSIRYRLSPGGTGFLDFTFSEPMCSFVDLSLNFQNTMVISSTDPIEIWVEPRTADDQQFLQVTGSGTNTVTIVNTDPTQQHQADIYITGNLSNLKWECTSGQSANGTACTYRMEVEPASSGHCITTRYQVDYDASDTVMAITNLDNPADVPAAVDPSWVLADCATI